MEGVNFDIKRLKRGLPIRWQTPYDKGDRFGLIADVNEKHITIMAVNAAENLNFKSKEYHITEIAQFELLGEWKEQF